MKLSWKRRAIAALALVVAGVLLGLAGRSRPPSVPAIKASRAVIVAPRIVPRSSLVSAPLMSAPSRPAPAHHAHHAAPSTANATAEAPAATSEHIDTPGVAGVVVAIDPKTGKMVMPSAEQMQRLTAAAAAGQPSVSRSPEGLVEKHYPNGMVEIDLRGRFQDYATVRIRPDGTKEFHCVTDTSADAMARAAAAEAAGQAQEGTARRGTGAPKEER